MVGFLGASEADEARDDAGGFFFARLCTLWDDKATFSTSSGLQPRLVPPDRTLSMLTSSI